MDSTLVRAYLRDLFALQHHELLLKAYGIDPAVLAYLLKNPSPPSGGPTHLDTKSNCRGANGWADMERAGAKIPPSFVKHALNHERVKKSVVGSIKKCIHLAISKRRKFDPERTAKRIGLCQTSHIVFRHAREFLILPVPCLSPFCPSCSRRRAAQRIDQIREQITPRKRRLDLRWITLTIRNTPLSTLNDTLNSLLDAWKTLRRDDSYRNQQPWSSFVRGYLWNLEVTFNNRKSTWHPHIHILYDGGFYPIGELDHAWTQRLQRRGLEGRAIVGKAYFMDERGHKHFLTEATEQNEKAISACLEEVSKYTLAPVESRGTPAEAVAELAGALYGRILRGSVGSLALHKPLKMPNFWIKAGSMSQLLDESSLSFLKNPIDQKNLLIKAAQHPAVWNNLIQNYEFFYRVQQASNDTD
jgi:hypothetical protein